MANFNEKIQRPLTELPAWQALKEHYDATASRFDLRTLFASDPGRFAQLSVDLPDLGLLADFSKNLWDSETLALLGRLVEEAGVEAAREALLAGLPINTSEDRAVLHVALRSSEPMARRDAHGNTIDPDVTTDVRNELQAMRRIATGVRDGTWTGSTGRAITHVVNIGIGGSDLGPGMVCAALQPITHDPPSRRLHMHFVSNVDGSHVAELLATLDPETTLFVVVSKTFTTAETMANARAARTWLVKRLAPKIPRDSAPVVPRHFIAVTANPQRATTDFGIDAAIGVVRFWDWVGGRFSLWSGAGLAIALAIGYEGFEELLAGAAAIDTHFRTAPFARNIPMLMAVLGVWYGGVWQCRTHAVLPYDQHLARLPAYLQQAEMESNGKGVDRRGRPVPVPTAPVVWGEPGTTGQHAFFQLLHQGTQMVPCDFLVGLQPPVQSDDLDIDVHVLHRMLVANCIAQTEALMVGKSLAQVQGEHGDRVDPVLLAQKTFPGNRPSTTLAYRQLSPRVLGALIACYEHKIFVQGILWRINSFDQWGVELGKQLASIVEKELEGDGAQCCGAHDASTSGLIALYHESSRKH